MCLLGGVHRARPQPAAVIKILICQFSRAESLVRVQELAGKTLVSKEVDLRDAEALDAVFEEQGPFAAVLHFAGLKAVGESNKLPLLYYRANVVGSLNLLDCMEKYNCKRMLFSSSATVYGDPVSVPIDESFAVQPTNPYGRTKLMIEDILRDVCASNSEWNVTILRYFNPVGAHESGRIGMSAMRLPNNIYRDRAFR